MTGGGLSAVRDFGFAGACLVTWFRPTAFGDRMVHHIAMVMLLEFFVVHSAGFMGVVAASDQPRARRLLLMLGLAGLYTVFTAAYSVGFGSWWMVGAPHALFLPMPWPSSGCPLNCNYGAETHCATPCS